MGETKRIAGHPQQFTCDALTYNCLAFRYPTGTSNVAGRRNKTLRRDEIFMPLRQAVQTYFLVSQSPVISGKRRGPPVLSALRICSVSRTVRCQAQLPPIAKHCRVSGNIHRQFWERRNRKPRRRYSWDDLQSKTLAVGRWQRMAMPISGSEQTLRIRTPE